MSHPSNPGHLRPPPPAGPGVQALCPSPPRAQEAGPPVESEVISLWSPCLDLPRPPAAPRCLTDRSDTSVADGCPGDETLGSLWGKDEATGFQNDAVRDDLRLGAEEKQVLDNWEERGLRGGRQWVRS